MKLSLDFETRSAVDLKKVGAYVYANHPSTQVMCAAFNVNNAKTRIWWKDELRPANPSALPYAPIEQLFMWMAASRKIEAHNAMFEYFIWKYHCTPRLGWPNLPVERLHCSMAKAAMHNLPLSLHAVGAALGLDTLKDDAGHRLMLRMSKPRRPRQDERADDPFWMDSTWWWEEPDQLQRLYEYCIRDVEAEIAVSNALRDLPEKEQKIWQLDLEINDRGMAIDVQGVKDTQRMIQLHAQRENAKVPFITDGMVQTTSQLAKVLEFCESRRVKLPNLQKATVAEYLVSPGPKDPNVVDLLRIRSSLSKSSTAKFSAMERIAQVDGRAHGLFQYHAASTGRWGGRLIQPQNLPRGSFKLRSDEEVETAYQDIAECNLPLLEMSYGDPMEVAAAAIRGAFRAKKGHSLYASDFASVEARVLAWLAMEESALDVFRQGKDPYKTAAAAIFGVPYEQVTKDQRQIGKVAELALGYQGAVGAFQSMARGYGIVVPDERAEEIVRAWREARPETRALWARCEDAALRAVQQPGKVFKVGRLAYGVRGRFLACRLPSGRFIYYYHPTCKVEPVRIKKPDGTIVSFRKWVLRYKGTDSRTHQWKRLATYGGKLVENAVQATSACLLREAMLRVAEAHFDIVLHVHDEIVAEVPDDSGKTFEEYNELVAACPPWADGLPMAADGFVSKRYRKD